MSNAVFVKEYAAPPLNEREALRYGGVRGEAGEALSALFAECVAESQNVLSYRVCYAVCSAEETKALFAPYADLSARLCGAKYAVLFTATVGLGMDRLETRCGQNSPAKALLLQGLGAERVESLCDAFCEDIRKESEKRGWKTGARFSPGYGDFPLTAQKKMVEILQCSKQIGVSLTDSLLLSPTKSVTAIVAVGEREETRETCAVCTQKHCAFRK